jgi:hypothetical protein
MTNHITTYFYHDIEDVGATYGNIFLPLSQRNLIYWQTVYTLFFTAIVQNGFENTKYTVFTNIIDFPLRHEIESLGVRIKCDLKLTHRNPGKWATVKFFFDVIEYIEKDSDFACGDNVLMLDTDCICFNDAQSLFSALSLNGRPIALVTGESSVVRLDFHGLPISYLEDIYENVFLNSIDIKETIGGEFFLFKKGSPYTEVLRNKYKILFESNLGIKLTTEEQILTMLNANIQFNNVQWSIHRIWTTYRHRDIPKQFNKFIFLHLPSEKQYGLSRLFHCLVFISPGDVSPDKINAIILKCIPLNNLIKLYLKKITKDVRSKIKLN